MRSRYMVVLAVLNYSAFFPGIPWIVAGGLFRDQLCSHMAPDKGYHGSLAIRIELQKLNLLIKDGSLQIAKSWITN